MTGILSELLDGVAGGVLREYVVQPADNLTSIAKCFYGKCEPRYALAIYQANRDKLDDPNHISPGQTLIIPHIAHTAPWHG